MISPRIHLSASLVLLVFAGGCLQGINLKNPHPLENPGDKIPSEKPAPAPVPEVTEGDNNEGAGIDPSLAHDRFTHIFAPRDANARVTGPNDKSYAILDNRVAKQHNFLALYLPGSGAVPTDNDRKVMAETAASFGLHVLSLKWSNNNPQSRFLDCIFGIGTRCHGPYHKEQLEGGDESPYIDIGGRENSLEKRLYDQLVYLDRNFPEEGWGQYLDATEVKWEKLVVFGHSAGGAMAGYVGKVRKVHRVVMLSGPYDSDKGGSPADWITDAASATPLENFYGFSHESDNQHSQHVSNWKAMGLPQIVRFESIASNAPLSPHRIFSSNNTKGGPAHNRTEAGPNSPRSSNGTFVYLRLWKYLLTGEE